jgi:hypothetical protein
MSSRPLERNEAVTDLIAIHPCPKAQFVVCAYTRFPYRGERVIPSSKQLVVLLANKIGADINMVYEAEPLASPDSFGLCRIRVKALKAHEAAEDR